MAARPSRTYKLKLSDKGIGLFLDCHSRLCRLATDLLPYGTTLRVSVMMLESMSADELVSQLGDSELMTYTGGHVRFVGTSPSLATLSAQLVDRAVLNGGLDRPPRAWLLFLTALSCMKSADDARVLGTYEMLEPTTLGAGAR